MPADLARMGRRLAPIAVLVAACSDPRQGERVLASGEAVRALPTEDIWTIVQTGDFNGDGCQDALWNNADHSKMAVWLLRGTELLAAGPTIEGPPSGPGWATITDADFNDDGLTDVPWYHAGQNRLAVWLMRGTEVLAAGPEIPGPTGGAWEAVEAGDFDGDGLADVLWHDPRANRWAVWLMRGTVVEREGPALRGPEGKGWTVAQLGDFNHDGMFDILWFNVDTCAVAVWLMRGTEPLEIGPEIPPPPWGDWEEPTVADFDGDGRWDVLWNDTTKNEVTVWLMDGTCVREEGPTIHGPGGSGWVAASSGDTNGDGLADVVWQNLHTRTMAVWLMRGTEVVAKGGEIPGPT